MFASLGIGGVGFAAVGSLSKYSTFFYILTFILLGVSYFLVAKNGKRLNKIIFWVSTLMVLSMMLYTKREFLTNLLGVN